MSLFIPVAAAATGAASHLLYFHHGEHHLYPVVYLKILASLFMVSIIALTHYGHLPVKESFNLTSSVTGYFLAGLYTSLLVYRAFLNPLNKFPGPYFARFSKFYFVFVCAKLDANKQLLRMHEKYGKLVRFGPNDLSITEPDGVQVITGVASKCTKADW